ncbi:hypothetical protein BGZ60DRAFT_112435 [Tricladium varicosporioides]|nr:hypothetical protein BGZ60DRAFT_112435 [Hymenoscyphus varicosporioides]
MLLLRNSASLSLLIQLLCLMGGNACLHRSHVVELSEDQEARIICHNETYFLNFSVIVNTIFLLSFFPSFFPSFLVCHPGRLLGSVIFLAPCGWRAVAFGGWGSFSI